MIFIAFFVWFCRELDLNYREQPVVIVHILEVDVDLEVDGQHYRVDSKFNTPATCELSYGKHRAVLRRGQKVLYDREFEVDQDGYVLTVWDELGQTR